MAQAVAELRADKDLSVQELLDEQLYSLSEDELLLLYDEDETRLEEREAALLEIAQFVATQAAKAELEHWRLVKLQRRYDLIERNVKTLRRRRERINFRFPDGTRIYDLEVIND
ncbi:MAG TPA: hypothetical protein VF723_11410 [Pyrinomonadaceae bacterium]|jgi:hypothetical protein